MATPEQRQKAIKDAAALVRSGTSPFLRRATVPQPCSSPRTQLYLGDRVTTSWHAPIPLQIRGYDHYVTWVVRGTVVALGADYVEVKDDDLPYELKLPYGEVRKLEAAPGWVRG